MVENEGGLQTKVILVFREYLEHLGVSLGVFRVSVKTHLTLVMFFTLTPIIS